MYKKNGHTIRYRGVAAIITILYRIFMTLGSLCVLLSFWQIAAETLGDFVLPEPLAVAKRALEIVETEFLGTISITLTNGLKGAFLSIFFGVSLGWLSGLLPFLYMLLRPWNAFLLGTPPIIWVVLAFFWFGLDSGTITIFTTIMSVAPMLFAAGVMSVETRPTQLLEMAKIYHLPKHRVLRYIYLPHMVTTLMPAITVATGMGIKVTVMAELLVSSHGIGAMISTSREILDTTSLVAYVLIAVVIILMLEFFFLNVIRRLVLPREQDE